MSTLIQDLRREGDVLAKCADDAMWPAEGEAYAANSAMCFEAADCIEAMLEATGALCAAIDNLWNHPDLVRVRAEIPESIKLNISKGQQKCRTARDATRADAK
jgi:hypothetical protein